MNSCSFSISIINASNINRWYIYLINIQSQDVGKYTCSLTLELSDINEIYQYTGTIRY